MSELDLLNIVRGATQNEVSWFAQVITINFAMIVAIYYFLSRAGLALRVFSFVAYMVGSFIYLGEMLIEANVKKAAIDALRALPEASLSAPSRQLLSVTDGWLGLTTSFVFNFAFWMLGLGVFYLLFFWRKSAHVAPP